LTLGIGGIWLPKTNQIKGTQPSQTYTAPSLILVRTFVRSNYMIKILF